MYMTFNIKGLQHKKLIVPLLLETSWSYKHMNTHEYIPLIKLVMSTIKQFSHFSDIHKTQQKTKQSVLTLAKCNGILRK